MDVYTFDKSFLERLREAEAVLSWDGAVMPASQVRSEWKSFVELQIEPAGWQAIWKIPRVICEDLKLRYPTIVYGSVDQVIFDELKAVFCVTAVQDNDVHLPERNEVSLIELWPTLQQENSALNVDTTAECIDRLRFFYTHVWLPWDKDHDDDRDWVQMHLQARIQLACDLSKNKLPRTLALHIRTLLMEARYIQQRLEFLELDLSDAEEESEDEALALSDNAGGAKSKRTTNSPSQKQANISLNKSNLPVTDLMCLHLRLAIIRSEFEILENPEMRRAYSELQSHTLKRQLLHRGSGNADNLRNDAHTCYLVTQPSELSQQLDLLTLAKQYVRPETLVQLGNNLQDVLSICKPNDNILLAPGLHTIKFLEHLNDNGSIKGLVEPGAAVLAETEKTPNDKLATVSSSDEDSILMVIDGDYTLSHLLLDCRNVRRGILLRAGTLLLDGCRLIGDGCSSTQEGIVCMPQAKLLLQGCVIESFAVGVSLQAQSSAEFNDVKLKKCTTGLEVLDKSVVVNLQGSNCLFKDCKFGILADNYQLPDSSEKTMTLARYIDLKSYNKSNLMGSCEFRNCQRNVRVLNESDQLSKRTYKCLLEDDLAGENKENIN
ncbi:protein nessun dorma [Scaptodrosophila lebanonensis]|uniref:Protein nessun dorma n=1 Tax=Drosophila lebanonensis TaxID=7225 RepID=A0A6J2TKC1_DROLE|nr:protein nessun dorma [Scaptodrosophila lebanonensis]